jgi:hypothetical protein
MVDYPSGPITPTIIPDPLLGHGALVANALMALVAIALGALAVVGAEAFLLGDQSMSAFEVTAMMANCY